jgi:hypothetical protein
LNGQVLRIQELGVPALFKAVARFQSRFDLEAVLACKLAAMGGFTPALAFQTAAHLATDAIVGPLSWRKLVEQDF